MSRSEASDDLTVGDGVSDEVWIEGVMQGKSTPKRETPSPKRNSGSLRGQARSTALLVLEGILELECLVPAPSASECSCKSR